MAERSKELVQVGYYLSRFGIIDPPIRLNTKKWNEAYRLFYDSLNGGRGVNEFEHSLKNSRDGFDSYFNLTQREGWKDMNTGEAARLTGFSEQVFKEFSNKEEQFIWDIISIYLESTYQVNPQIFNDLISEDTSNSDSNSTRTEGGVKVRISKTIERNSALRQQVLDLKGYCCEACGFNFLEKYGNWGRDFAEVHHIIPLSELKGKEQLTDPKKHLAVLCSNCHSMVHRKRGISLSISELKLKITNNS